MAFEKYKAALAVTKWTNVTKSKVSMTFETGRVRAPVDSVDENGNRFISPTETKTWDKPIFETIHVLPGETVEIPVEFDNGIHMTSRMSSGVVVLGMGLRLRREGQTYRVSTEGMNDEDKLAIQKAQGDASPLTPRLQRNDARRS